MQTFQGKLPRSRAIAIPLSVAATRSSNAPKALTCLRSWAVKVIFLSGEGFGAGDFSFP